MLTVAQKFEIKLRNCCISEISILFEENEGAGDEVLQHLRDKDWSNLSELHLGFNPLKMTRTLQFLQFPSLIVLSLRNCDIESIEHMSSLYLPKLQQLIIKHNHISTVRSIKKLNCPFIHQISLYRNPIRDCNQAFAELECEKLEEMKIQYSNSRVISEDKRWVFKLQSKRVRMLMYSSLNEIAQSQTDLLMKQKFQQNEL